MTTRTATLTAATITTGLLAGTFYAFACAVMPGLARSEDEVYVEVMRDINEVIQNPVFLLSFLGAPVLTGLAAWQLRRDRRRWWVWAAAAANTLALLLTFAVNIPLNDALAGPGDPSELREDFEGAWVAWNVVRGVLVTAGLGCLAAGRSAGTTAHPHSCD
ncbi:anthrone oxygenase family protein [Streptomyces sp. NPDC003635]